MGRLVIAHHKSYHPYRRDNIERVRKDEEEAALKEKTEEGRVMLADSEARIDRLRERRGTKGKERAKDDMLELDRPRESQEKKHINFFEDLEQNAITASIRATKSTAKAKEEEKGVPLAPSVKDLNPWYSSKERQEEKEKELDDKMKRDLLRKSTHDPLTSINHLLSSKSSSSSSSSRPRHHLPATPTNERLTRESSERQRALALIQRKKREMMGSETPSTVHGEASEYGDMYNRREVEEAHLHRDKGRRDLGRRKW